MTIQEIIKNVMEDLERPDIEAQLLSRIRGALDSAHSIDNSTRDITSVKLLVAPNLLNGALSINTKELSKRFKSPYAIKLYNRSMIVNNAPVPDYESRINLPIPYKETSGVMLSHDNYGNRYPNTYSYVGGILNFKGMATGATIIELDYLAYPTYTINQVSGLPVTDSWILKDMPDLIRAYLSYHAINYTANDSLRQMIIGELQRVRAEFIGNYHNTFYPEIENGIYS